METVVVNLYKDPYDVYIGRAGKGLDGYFGNPFFDGDRDYNLKRFKEHFFQRLKTDAEYQSRILGLRGKRLGCFCHPKPCHGHIIADYLNSIASKQVRMAVIGSRTFWNYQFLEDTLKWYDISLIISGGAKGADTLAVKYAMQHNIKFKEFIPDWVNHGKSAGLRRNEKIIAEAEEVVAFWNGTSKGTAHSIRLAEAAGKPVYVYWPPVIDCGDEIENLGL